jgi:hypothetical protein
MILCVGGGGGSSLLSLSLFSISSSARGACDL